MGIPASLMLAKVISIHAPQWGATHHQSPPFQRCQISIHAPQWGATQPGYHTGLVHLFQSTHPSGVRLVGSIIGIPNWISIHAPQWGATTSRYHYRKRTGYFNPRTPVGCDTGLVRVAGGDLISIHAPQWGATITSEMVCWSALFQSTHPSGVRRTPPLNRSHSAIFQSTHPSGVRRFLAAYYSNQV